MKHHTWNGLPMSCVVVLVVFAGGAVSCGQEKQALLAALPTGPSESITLKAINVDGSIGFVHQILLGELRR